MKIKYKLLIIAFLGLLTLMYSTPSFEARGESDIGIVGMEVGSCFIFNIDQSDFAPAQYFAVNLGVSKSINAGFTSIKGDGVIALNYDLFKLSYFIFKASPIGMDILVGGCGGNVAAGLDIFFNIFQNRIEDSLSTVLKFKLGYLITETGNPTGSVLATLTGQIGF